MWARRYALYLVWSEAQIARERVNKQIATEAVATYNAVATIVGGGDAFRKMIENLNGE